MTKHTPAPVGGRKHKSKTHKTMKKGGRKSRRVGSKKTRKGVKKGRSRRSRRGGADEEEMEALADEYLELLKEITQVEGAIDIDEGEGGEYTADYMKELEKLKAQLAEFEKKRTPDELKDLKERVAETIEDLRNP